MINKPYIDMRTMMKRIRNAQIGIYETSVSSETTKKNPTTPDFMNKLRRLNEDVETEDVGLGKNLKTDYDQQQEEQKMTDNFKDLNVNMEFIDLEVYNKGIFWGGTIDGQIQWIYKVTPDKSTSGFEINYLPDFDPNNKDNKDIIDKIEQYYDTFYKYWRNNTLQKT